MREIGFVAPRSKTVAKPRWTERLSVFRHEKRKSSHRGEFEGCRKLRVKRNVDFHPTPVLVLGLDIANPACPNVLPSKPHDIFPASRREKQERQGEISVGPDWVAGLEPGDLL